MDFKDKNKIFWFIICYNSTFCVEYQIKTIKAFCEDPFEIIIIDSNCGEFKNESLEKKNLCIKNKVNYISLPNELRYKEKDGTFILAKKLNYVYENYVKKIEPKYFAFIDQDMFLIKKFSIVKFLDEYGMWGDVDEKINKKSPNFNKCDIIKSPWYLHPWLSFYKYDFVKNYNLKWDPHNSDTGGKLWKTFVKQKNLDKSKYWFRENIIMLYPFAGISDAGPKPYKKHYFKYNNNTYYGQIQINNEFIHLLNSRYLSDQFNPKVCYFRGILDGLLFSSGIKIDKENNYETFDSPRKYF